MKRILLSILFGLFCCGPALYSAGQTRKIDSPEVLKQLLAMPAPTPRHAGTPAPTPTAQTRSNDFYSRANTPPDDAPIADLIDYWTRWIDSNREPTETVSKRLLEACIDDPTIFPQLLDLLPYENSTFTKIKDIYDKALTDPKFTDEWRDKVKTWLLFNTKFFLDELMALARKAKENPRDGAIEKEDELSALARVSWSDAEPLLRGLMASGQPRVTALALSLFYEHAVAEKDLANEERYRRDLQAIATNRNQPGYARTIAIESLSLTEWSGRDDWYIGLLQDESLLEPLEGDYSFEPFDALFSSDLEKWVPIMARLVESKDINVRSAAAARLVSVSDEEEITRKALTALLPWLTNPDWMIDPSTQRTRLIRTLGSTRIPESVPGLIWVLENDEDDYPRSTAAESLALYQDSRAVPALKKALAKEKVESQRFRIIKGLLGSNGLLVTEQLEALEAYASKIASPETRLDVTKFRTPDEEPLSPTLTIGKYLGQVREAPSESLIAAVLARAEVLKSENSPVAAALIEITHQWQGQLVELDIIRRIGNGSADSATVSEALDRKDRMQESLRTELQGLASVEGAAQGVGAVLLNDPAMAQGILNSQDEPAQIALLACARLSQTALPVELIGRLLRHQNQLLAQAAERYLLAEDSREARELLWQHHPNEAFVTGWRENYWYHGLHSGIAKSEEQLRAEVLKENGPIEILALVTDPVHERIILRIYSDKAVYTHHEDDSRYRERTVPMAEVAGFKDFLSAGGFSERGPAIGYCHHVCPATELLMLTREKGRRVFHQGFAEWLDLRENFTQMGTGDGAKMHYKLEDEIKGLEVLYAGELLVKDVTQQGAELRVLVERPKTKDEIDQLQASYRADEEDDAEQQLQMLKWRFELVRSIRSWRVLTNDQIGSVTSAPDFYSVVDPIKFITGDENDLDWDIPEAALPKMIAPDSIVFAPDYDGLWRQFPGSKPIRIGDLNASYLDSLVTRDGNWVIVRKRENRGSGMNQIVRLNLQSGREFRVQIPLADQLEAIVSLPVINRVLIKRAKLDFTPPGLKATGPDKPEYYLLDPANGVTRMVTGDFEPLRRVGYRFLQAADKPDEFWAAIPNEQKNHTQIGRYSLRDFSFKSVMTVPHLIFDSMSMWLDGGQKKVYVVYKGQLLRLPLQASEK